MPDYLPDEFRFSHDYCFFLHDQLVETIKSGEKADIFNIQIRFKDKHEASQFSGLSGEELIEWLEAHDYKNDVHLLYFKQVTAALLSDLLHFVYEVLNCSKKGKLTVTYALLRKPFKDNLFYLEWLLGDPENFLSRFDSERLNRFSLPPKVSRTRKIELIRSAMKQTRHEDWLDAEFMYELRYDKGVAFGLEPLWQKANHLFTSFRYLETERCNFNFVFSNEEARYSQWKQIYSFVPILLFHTVQVVEALIEKFAERVRVDNVTPLRTYIGMLLWMQNGPWKAKMAGIEHGVQEAIKEADLVCPTCGHEYLIDREGLERLYSEGSMRCSACGKEQNLIHEL